MKVTLLFDKVYIKIAGKRGDCEFGINGTHRKKGGFGL